MKTTRRTISRLYLELTSRGYTGNNFKTIFNSLPKHWKEYAEKNKEKLLDYIDDVEIEQKEATERLRIAKKAESFNIAQKRVVELEEKAKAFLESFDPGYIMGSDKYLTLSGKAFLYLNETEEYSRSSKFRATHGWMYIAISKAEFLRLTYKSGVWVSKLGKNEEAVFYKEYGRYGKYEVKAVKGFFTKKENDYFFFETEEEKNKFKNL